MEAAEFLRRINRSLPPGLKFSSLEPLPGGAPSLANAIEKLVYSVDWKSADAGPARTAAGLRAALGRFRGGPSGAPSFDFVFRGKRLILLLPPLPTKGARVQDVVREVFGIEEPAFLVRRDRVVLRN
jgi:hypothetical protein